MVVSTEAPGAAEVILVLECTAANGAYINELRTNYILPTLEYFHGSSPDEGGSAVYGAVVCHAADCRLSQPATTLGPYTSPQHLLNAIDKLQFVGGRGESQVCLAEGLSVALCCLEELGRADAARHVILMCCSPPYSAAAGGVAGYPGSATAEQAAKALGERGAHLSVVAPRKLPALLRLFEHAGGDLAAAQARNYAKDPRHLVLLRGFTLKERPPSPAPPPALAAEPPAPPEPPAHGAYRAPAPRAPQPFAAGAPYPRGPLWRVPQQQRPPYAANSVLLTQLAQPSYPPPAQPVPQQPRMPSLGPAPPQPTAGPSVGVGGPGAAAQAPSQRTYIWQGVLEWMEKGKGPGDQQKVTKHLPCQVSSNSKDIEPDLKADTWPNKLLMQLMPKQLIGNIGGQYLKDSKSVLFHLQQNEALDSLTNVMVNGFAGCVHFQPVSQCDIKVLILLYTADKKAYLGFIPNNQATFVDRLRKVIQQQKYTQMSKQAPGAVGAPGAGAGPSQALALPQQMPQLPQGNMMMAALGAGGGGAGGGGAGGGGGVAGGGGKVMPRAQRPLDDLEAARQQNLEKIQQLQQTLEAAQQQEAQYRWTSCRIFRPPSSRSSSLSSSRRRASSSSCRRSCSSCAARRRSTLRRSASCAPSWRPTRACATCCSSSRSTGLADRRRARRRSRSSSTTFPTTTTSYRRCDGFGESYIRLALFMRKTRAKHHTIPP